VNILVIAYEFPPICSAQSLRWHYLTAELAAMGHCVRVITTDFRVGCNLAPAPDSRVDVVRGFPGLFMGTANRLEQRLAAGRSGHSRAFSQSGRDEGGLERIYRISRKALDQIVFPDLRSEWYPFAARVVRRLARTGYRPDIVIGSHEPAVDLQLGFAVKSRFDVPFLADFGDPIDTVYSPRWRRRLDRRYEAYVLSRADGVIVTLGSVRSLLETRHAYPRDRIEVIPQGFDHRRSAPATSVVPFAADHLNILFTGTLYESFRNPTAFLDAVGGRSDVVLWIAGNLVGEFPAVARNENIRLLGSLAHTGALDAQASADVLLSIGNRQLEQIPGKIYEYFGSRRPILHLYSDESDPTCELVKRLRCGWNVKEGARTCGAMVENLVARWREGSLEHGLDLVSDHAGQFSWHARAERLVHFIGSRKSAYR